MNESAPEQGAGSHEDFYGNRDYRSLTNRGPVLDSTDDISVYQSINVGDTITAFSGEVRIHMVWDVAEVDEAGRAFSVPR